MTAPTSDDKKRLLWVDFEDFYHFDLNKTPAIVWHDDAPKEALESYEFYLKTR